MTKLHLKHGIRMCCIYWVAVWPYTDIIKPVQFARRRWGLGAYLAPSDTFGYRGNVDLLSPCPKSFGLAEPLSSHPDFSTWSLSHNHWKVATEPNAQPPTRLHAGQPKPFCPGGVDGRLCPFWIHLITTSHNHGERITYCDVVTNLYISLIPTTYVEITHPLG